MGVVEEVIELFQLNIDDQPALDACTAIVQAVQAMSDSATEAVSLLEQVFQRGVISLEDFTAAVDVVTGATGQLAGAASAAAGAVDAAAGAVASSAQGFQQLGTALTQDGIYLDDFSRQFNGLTQNVPSLTAALDGVTTGLDAQTLALQRAGQSAADYVAMMESGGGAMEAATMGMGEFDASVELTSVYQMDLADNLEYTARSASLFGGAIEVAQLALRGLGVAADAAVGGLESLGEALTADTEEADAAGASFMNMQMALMLVVTVLGGAIIGFEQLGMAGQNAFAIVQGMAGVSDAQLAPAMGQLQTMAINLGVSMEQVGQALYYVTSAGYDLANGGMKVMQASLEASRASGAQFNVVASALTSVLHAFNLSANDASATMDKMVEGVVRGKMDFQEFASSIGPLADIAHNVGIGLDQTVAALATFSQVNPHVRQDAQELGFLFNALDLSVDKVAKTAQGLGISFNETAYKSMSLIEQLDYLAKQAGGPHTAAFEKLVGGVTGLKAALALLGDQGKDYEKTLDNIDHAQGATDAAFQKSDETISGAWSHVNAALSVVAQNFVDSITPQVSGALKQVTDALTGFARQGSAVTPIISGLSTAFGILLVGAILAIVGPLIAAAAPLILIATAAGAIVVAIQKFPPLHDFVQHLADSFGQWNAKVQPLQTAMNWISTTLHQITDAFNQVFPPIQHAAQAVKPLADDFDRATGVFGKLIPVMKPVLDTFDRTGGIMKTAASQTKPLLDDFDRATGVFNKLIPAAHGAQQAVNPFIPIFQGIANVIRFLIPIFEAIGTAVNFVITHFHLLLPVFQQLIAFLSSTFRPVWEQMVNSFNDIKTALAPIMPQIILLAQGLGVILGGAIILAIAILAGLISMFAQVLIGIMKFVTGVIQVFSGLVQIVTGVMNLITDVFTGKWGQIGADIDRVMHGILSVIIGVLNMVWGIWTATWGAVQGFAQGFASAIVGIFQNLAAIIVGHSIIPDMCNAIIATMTGMISTVIGLITGWVSSFIGLINSLASQAIGGMQNVVSGILGVLSSLPGQAAGFISSMMSNIVGTINSWVGNVKSAVSNVAGAIASILQHTTPKEGPLSGDDQWMVHFGDTLVAGLNANVSRVGEASRQLADSIATPHMGVLSGASGALAGAGGGTGVSHGQVVLLLSQILAVLRSGGGANRPVGPSLPPSLTQYNTNNLYGTQSLQDLYGMLNAIAGNYLEQGGRGLY